MARNLVGELVLLADHFDTETAPRKDEKKAAGPAKIPRTDTRSAGMEVNIKRIGELKAKYPGVGKALRLALIETAGRTSQELGHPAYYSYGRRKAQDGALVVEMEKVQCSNIGRRVACYEAQQESKPKSVQRETLLEMTTIENQYRVTDSS